MMVRMLRALLGQPHPHRAAVDVALLVVHVAALDELLEVVGDVRALVVAAGLQLARRHLVVADVEQQQRLHRVDVDDAEPLELVLDHVEQQPVQPFHHRERLEIGAEKVLRARRARARPQPSRAYSWCHSAVGTLRASRHAESYTSR